MPNLSFNSIFIIFIIFSGIVIACTPSSEQITAKKYKASTKEVKDCLIYFNKNEVNIILENLLNQRRFFPLSYFEKTCYDFIELRKKINYELEYLITANKNNWTEKNTIFHQYVDSKEKEKKRIILKKEKEEAINKVSQENIKFTQYNKKYMSMLFSILKEDSNLFTDELFNSYIEFFLHTRLKRIFSTKNEFEIRDFYKNSKKDLIEKINTAEKIPRNISLPINYRIGSYDFENKRFYISKTMDLESEKLDIPCLSVGVRGICLDGRNRDRPRVKTGILPKEISYTYSGGPLYLYAPENVARTIREQYRVLTINLNLYLDIDTIKLSGAKYKVKSSRFEKKQFYQVCNSNNCETQIYID